MLCFDTKYSRTSHFLFYTACVNQQLYLDSLLFIFDSVAPIYKFADIPIYRCLSKNTADIDNDTDINTLMINSVCELSIAIKFLKGWFLNKLDNSRGRFRKSLRNY